METEKKGGKVKVSNNVVTSFRAYKKKYFPKRYAEEESVRVPRLRMGK